MRAMANTDLEITSDNAEQTQELGERFGMLARAGDVYCLEGDLGAGKTCFVQGLGRGLKIPSAIHSPTFILANEHRGGRLTLYHLDVYRMRGAGEALGIGIDDYLFGDGVCVIEWAEKISGALPEERLWVTFQYIGDEQRKLTFRAKGARYQALLSELKNVIGN